MELGVYLRYNLKLMKFIFDVRMEWFILCYYIIILWKYFREIYSSKVSAEMRKVGKKMWSKKSWNLKI